MGLPYHALCAPVLNFFYNLGEKSTTIHIDNVAVDYNTFANQSHGLMLPNHLPKTYSVVTLDRIDQYYIVNYIVSFENAEKDMITLEIILEGSATGIDNEGVQKKNLP